VIRSIAAVLNVLIPFLVMVPRIDVDLGYPLAYPFQGLRALIDRLLAEAARLVDMLWLMHEAPRRSPTPQARALTLACTAGMLGTLYAAVSAYWGAGGTALLDTIGGALEREGRAGTAGILAVIWITVVLKLAASAIGLLAVAQPQWLSRHRARLARRAAWLVALLLTLYGGALTVTGLLVQADIVHASDHADHRALRWHAFLWDPWFLVWGLMLAIALSLSREV
jgi:hypothetical protein